MTSLIAINEWKTVKRRITIVFSSLFVITLFQSAIADYVYIDDGESHLIENTLYQNSSVILDYHTANNPGTYFHIIDGGKIWSLGVCNNSTIKVDGGLISYGISADNSSEIEVNGGTIGTIWAYDHSVTTINGGTFNGWLLVTENSVVEIRGGTFVNLFDFIVSNNGTIYLYGSNFSVGGVVLDYGDSLRDYGVVGGPNSESWTGTITGTLLDGSSLNSEFFIVMNDLNADIIIVPEPATSTLMLTLSIFLLRRRH